MSIRTFCQLAIILTHERGLDEHGSQQKTKAEFNKALKLYRRKRLKEARKLGRSNEFRKMYRLVRQNIFDEIDACNRHWMREVPVYSSVDLPVYRRRLVKIWMKDAPLDFRRITLERRFEFHELLIRKQARN